jgi:hypothetical protein
MRRGDQPDMTAEIRGYIIFNNFSKYKYGVV